MAIEFDFDYLWIILQLLYIAAKKKIVHDFNWWTLDEYKKCLNVRMQKAHSFTQRVNVSSFPLRARILFVLAQYLLAFNRFHVERKQDIFSLPICPSASPAMHLTSPYSICLLYLSCIRPIVSPYCTVFFHPHRRRDLGDIINLLHSRQSVSVLFPFSIGKPTASSSLSLSVCSLLSLSTCRARNI